MNKINLNSNKEMEHVVYSLLDIYKEEPKLCANLVYGLNYKGFMFEYHIYTKTSVNRISNEDIEYSCEFFPEFVTKLDSAQFRYLNEEDSTKDFEYKNKNSEYVRYTRYYLAVASSDNNLVNFYGKAEKLAIEKITQNNRNLFNKDDILKITEAIKKFSKIYYEVLISPDPRASMKIINDKYSELGNLGKHDTIALAIKEQRKESLAKELNEMLVLNKDKKSKVKI